MRWAIQTNLGSSRDAEALVGVCRALGFDAVEVVRPPFEDRPPDVPADQPTVFYGSASLIEAVVGAGRWQPGAWVLGDDYESWIADYGGLMLNASARVLSLAELAADAALANADDLVFARPCRDSKLFAGQVTPAAELVAWARRALAVEDTACTPETRVMLAEPVGLRDEWRLFVVDGEVVTGSHYRSYERLAVTAGVPDEVKQFAEQVLARRSPAPVCVIDVGRSGDELFVVEFNGACSSGFYAADLRAWVAAVGHFVTSS